ncbi:uncharacterized protein F4812DRAFT_470432 [Daldinia caldariorum]|uniref:uncharacterized protein n=1 Tax=Daldinia caldariorum TaxID=326644 RepID=UPI0020080BE6|nr:uncharacterized protein F4812DRAFT_470432 [Daldinia caldariorum]KAI1469513.1 hypothetical protein F4812DRAFT_470432 [Daldinia caldariorum]
MHRIKALFRRRGYDERSSMAPKRNKANLSQTRQSLDRRGDHKNMKEDHITSPKSQRHNRSSVDHKASGYKNPKNIARKEMPGHFHMDKQVSTEEQPKTLPVEIRNNKDDQLVPPTRQQDQDHTVKIINKNGSTTSSSSGERSSSEGEKVVDLRDTVDTDQTITYAPAVTHETIRPHVHEIMEEQIYREIHNHDVYHRIQPVYDVEILPARHFVPGADEMAREQGTAAYSFDACSIPARHRPETVVEHNTVREPVKEDVKEREGNFEPVRTRSTIDCQELKDVYSDS